MSYENVCYQKIIRSYLYAKKKKKKITFGVLSWTMLKVSCSYVLKKKVYGAKVRNMLFFWQISLTYSVPMSTR